MVACCRDYGSYMLGADLMPSEAGVQVAAVEGNLARVPGLEALRDLAQGGAGITIAVIDGPVDLDHPVFSGADIRLADGATHDGLVDPDKVGSAIDALLTTKPYLATQRPTQTIAQGVREDVPETEGLFALIRQRV